LAGFQVIPYGRFWVIPEASFRDLLADDADDIGTDLHGRRFEQDHKASLQGTPVFKRYAAHRSCGWHALLFLEARFLSGRVGLEKKAGSHSTPHDISERAISLHEGKSWEPKILE
jgi:hypothetical protein